MNLIGACVVGLDISYTSLGICAIAPGFIDGTHINWRKVIFKTLPRQPMTPAGRDHLAALVRQFVIWAGGNANPNLRVFAENVPRTGYHVLGLAKLHAVIEGELARSELHKDMEIANQSTARKLLFGRGRPGQGLIPKEKKAWVTEPLKLAGATFANHDEADAFVVANYGLSEMGEACLMNLLGEPEPKARKQRSRKAAA